MSTRPVSLASSAVPTHSPAEQPIRLADPPAARRPLATRAGRGLELRGLLDRSLALLLLILTSPLMLLVALGVRLSSAGPVLFAQPRVGQDGATFSMLKFRSMVTGAHTREDELAAGAGNGPFFKVRNDDRVTPLGNFLRRSSLDELPQLINVLRGDMALVGLRPLLLREHGDLPADVRVWRDRVKPGITGLWQVTGRSRTTSATRIRLDRLYAERESLGLDLRILLRTPRAVFQADGAV